MTDYPCLSIFSIFFQSKRRKSVVALGDLRRAGQLGLSPPTARHLRRAVQLWTGKHRHDANLNLDVRGMTATLCPKLCPVAAWTC